MKVEVTKEQSLIKNQRNSSLDFLKLFCSFLVIVFHAKPIYSQWTQPISCSAVPCFFMISGYLLYSDKLSERSLRSAKKTSIILFWSTLFYLPLLAYGIYTNSEGIKTLTEYIVDFLCFNENPASSHLWYLAAYVYDLLIVRYFYNRNLLVILFLAMPILWTVDMLGGLGGGKTIYLRNFLVTGIPCFTMGMLVRKCKMEKKVNSITMLLLIVLLSIGSVVESSYYESTHQNF